MSIKSTRYLTREQAVEKYIDKALEDYKKGIRCFLQSWSNSKLEEELERLDEENDNPFTNYEIRYEDSEVE